MKDVKMDSGSSASDVCPYDNYPCTRFDAELGSGVCEIKRAGMPADVCSRFVLKSGVQRFRIDFE